MFGNDNVCDRLEYKLYVTCICCTCDVSVDRLTTRVSVEANKLVSDEIHTILVGVSSYKKKLMVNSTFFYMVQRGIFPLYTQQV